MLSWALTFLVIALIAAALGFGGVAGAASGIAKILFFVFLVAMVIGLIFGLVFYLGLGILGRLMPQIQVFFMMMPANIIVGLVWPHGQGLTLVAYLPRQPDVYLKDAFLIPDHLEVVEDHFRRTVAADGGQTIGLVKRLD